MEPKLFEDLPDSTNAVESHNRFGKTTHRQPLKVAMMTTYKEDMLKALLIIASMKGLSTDYTNMSEGARSKRSQQQNKARRKRLHSALQDDDPDGPPDTKRTFDSGKKLQPRAYM